MDSYVDAVYTAVWFDGKKMDEIDVIAEVCLARPLCLWVTICTLVRIGWILLNRSCWAHGLQRSPALERRQLFTGGVRGLRALAGNAV